MTTNFATAWSNLPFFPLFSFGDFCRKYIHGTRYVDSISRRPVELLRVAATLLPWSEEKHRRFDANFRWRLGTVLMCADVSLDDANGPLPWDDIRRVLQGWSVLMGGGSVTRE